MLLLSALLAFALPAMAGELNPSPSATGISISPSTVSITGSGSSCIKAGSDGLTFTADCANKRIGIGNTSPVNKLSVAGAVGIGTGYTGYTGPTNGLLVEGAVGIAVGTTGPGTNKLAVAGSAAVGASYVGATGPTNGAIIEGSVGIGTTNPGSALDVVSGATNIAKFAYTPSGKLVNIYSDGTYAGITSAASLGGTGLYWRDDATKYLYLGVNGNQSMHLADGGNVGIGTTNPGNLLDVNGYVESVFYESNSGRAKNINFTPGVLISTFSATTTAGSSADTLVLQNQNTTDGNYTSIINVDSGIGYRNATINLINLSHTTHEGAIGLGARTAAGASVETMRITSANVGIGTTNPGAKLDVAGPMLAHNVSSDAFKMSSADDTRATAVQALDADFTSTLTAGATYQLDVHFHLQTDDATNADFDFYINFSQIASTITMHCERTDLAAPATVDTYNVESHGAASEQTVNLGGTGDHHFVCCGVIESSPVGANTMDIYWARSGGSGSLTMHRASFWRLSDISRLK